MQESENYDITNEELSKFDKIKNIKFGKELTLNEKIDYIYKTLKTQKRNAKIKLLLKFFVIISVCFIYFSFIKNISNEKIEEIKTKIIKTISSQTSSIVKPIVQEISKDMIKDMENSSSNSGEFIENTVNEILKGDTNSQKLQELYKKYPELKK